MGDTFDRVNLPAVIIAGVWLLFVAYWAIAAVGVKRSARQRPWRTENVLRLLAMGLMIALLQSRPIREHVADAQRAADHSSILGWIGVGLCLLGVALAIDARRHLGRNWGLPMSRKERPELITSGPYARIRHPIYTGLMLAMLGSALGIDVLWLVPLALASAYFIYSARREEATLLAQFPDHYPAYRARTDMLVPCPLRRR
jgi:protein-S-isoprenylcysteine O-methyltransferase Ste14